MKIETKTDRPREPSRVVPMHQEGQTDLETRSDPLKSTYNSTFIIVILVIAAILAVILLVWPAGWF